MFFKLYKIYNNYVEFNISLSAEENYEALVKLMKLFNLDFSNSVCACSYDRDRINLTVTGSEINIECIEKKQRFCRTIRFQETKIPITSNDALKNTLRISRAYDALLSITSTEDGNSSAVIIINDNGHDYVRFEKDRFDSKVIKEKIDRILNR